MLGLLKKEELEEEECQIAIFYFVRCDSGVLIWRYGAACSSIIFFAAPAGRNAAPEGRSLVINYAWVRPQVRATHVEVILATLKSLFLATTYFSYISE